MLKLLTDAWRYVSSSVMLLCSRLKYTEYIHNYVHDTFTVEWTLPYTTLCLCVHRLADGLAVDWLSNLLYWTEAGPGTISVYDLERGHRSTLVLLPDTSVPRGIALDPVEG